MPVTCDYWIAVYIKGAKVWLCKVNSEKEYTSFEVTLTNSTLEGVYQDKISYYSQHHTFGVINPRPSNNFV